MEAELATVSGRSQRLPTMASYFALIRGWRLIGICLLGVIGAVLGAAYSTRAVPEYRASVYIALPDLPQWVDVDPEPPNAKRTTIDTSANLVFSDPVVEAVATQIGVSIDEARNSLSVSARPLSRAAIVSYTTTDRDTAVAAANLAAQGMIEQRQTVLPGRRLHLTAPLTDKLLSLRGRSLKFPYRLTSMPGQLNALIARVAELQQRHVDQRASVVIAADTARLLPLHRELPIATGLTIGVLVGIGWAWLRGPPTSRVRRARRPAARTPARSPSPAPLGPRR
jgi:hypothetical protein